MKLFAIAFALLLVVSLSDGDLTLSSFNGDFSSLDAVSGQVPLSDLITVANYYGCKTWAKDQCLECSNGYSFNKNGVCCQISDLCSQFNKAEGVCQACYQGYAIVNGSCQLAAQDSGCAKWNGNTCIQCSQRWFFNTNGACTPVSDFCATWNSNGNCLTCYGGFVLSEGACVANPSPFYGSTNVFCASWQGTSCLKCASRAYFNQNGLCVPVSWQCQTWDPIDGSCLSCYAGYLLTTGGSCTQSPLAAPSDAGCSLWSSNQKTCLQCSHRFFFGANGQCSAVSDFCATWDKASGDCLSCYSGYDLSNGTCCVSLAHNDATDPGCASWDWNNNVCLKCSNNWVFNANKVCIQVSSQCNTFDSTGACVSCYVGYNLANGACVLAPVQQVSDVGCASWNWNKQICLQCSNNWVFNANKICVPVSDQCNTFDSTGACLSCYTGYSLSNGKCVLAPTQQVSDVGCATWNWNKQLCLQCSSNWVFNANKVCVPVSDQCNTFDSNGACLSCYVGYNLNNGKCTLAPVQQVSDAGCASWNWNKQICLECSNNWVFNANKVCVPVSDQCNTFDSTGACLSCYIGYNLNNGKCVLAPVQQVSDVGCATWNWNKQTCLQCSNNWVFNSNNVCVPVSDQCNTFDKTGACLSCYKGYSLNNGKCTVTPAQQISDVGCATWDWNKQVCQQCSNNWVFNANKVCVPVSDQCNTFDNSGACLSCYKGYSLSNGKCVLAAAQQVSDVGCGSWDWDKQVCLKCSARFVFNANKVCVPVSDNCNSWNAAGECTSCYSGYVLNGGSCALGNSLCKSSNSNGACTECYVGYLLNNGNCVPLSKLANLALYYSVCCPERLQSLNEAIASKGA